MQLERAVQAPGLGRRVHEERGLQQGGIFSDDGRS
jgi:hypothetical protein